MPNIFLGNPSARHPIVQTSPASLTNLATWLVSMTLSQSATTATHNSEPQTTPPRDSSSFTPQETQSTLSSNNNIDNTGPRDLSSAHQDHADEDDALTTVTVATDAPDDFVPPVAIEHQPKVGGKFFGCCDYRRAVMILSVVTIVTSLLDLLFLLINILSKRDSTTSPSPESEINSNESGNNIGIGFDDDVLVAGITGINDDFQEYVALMEGLAIVFGAVSLWGAARFEKWLILLALLFTMAEMVLGIFLAYQANEDINELLEAYDQRTFSQPRVSFVVRAIIAGIWWYPSIMLFVEIQKGIMTERTYAREEYSCCCFYYYY